MMSTSVPNNKARTAPFWSPPSWENAHKCVECGKGHDCPDYRAVNDGKCEDTDGWTGITDAETCTEAVLKTTQWAMYAIKNLNRSKHSLNCQPLSWASAGDPQGCVFSKVAATSSKATIDAELKGKTCYFFDTTGSQPTGAANVEEWTHSGLGFAANSLAVLCKRKSGNLTCTIPSNLQWLEGVAAWGGVGCSDGAQNIESGTSCVVQKAKFGYTCISPGVCKDGKFSNVGQMGCTQDPRPCPPEYPTCKAFSNWQDYDGVKVKFDDGNSDCVISSCSGGCDPWKFAPDPTTTPGNHYNRLKGYNNQVGFDCSGNYIPPTSPAPDTSL